MDRQSSEEFEGHETTLYGIIMVCQVFHAGVGRILDSGGSSAKVFGKSLYFLINFSVSLKLLYK